MVADTVLPPADDTDMPPKKRVSKGKALSLPPWEEGDALPSDESRIFSEILGDVSKVVGLDAMAGVANVFAKGEAVYKIIDACTLTAKGRKANDNMWRKCPFIGEEELRLRSAHVSDTLSVMLVLEPVKPSDIAFVRIPLNDAPKHLEGFSDEFEAFMKNSSAIKAIAEDVVKRHREAELKEKMLQADNNPEFGTW
jgi:hypothetical protein